MAYLATNFASSTLAVGLGGTVGDVTLQIQVGDVAKFPVINNGGSGSDFTMIVLSDSAKNREVIKCTRHDSSSASFTVERAQEGTSARVWQAGDSVSVRLTAGVVMQTYTHPDQTTGAHAASAISFTPAGSISATTVQAAIAELDTEKASLSGATFTGPVAINAQTLSMTNSTAYYPQEFLRNTTNDANAGYIGLEKNRAGGIVQNGDYLGNFAFRGFDGTQYLIGAGIAAVVSATPGANDMPTDLLFLTTPDGGAGPSERARIDKSGNFGLGVTPKTWSQGKALEVSGNGQALWGSSTGDLWLVNNGYYNGSWKFAAGSGTAKATYYRQGAGLTVGTHTWGVAGSGTADGALTFTDAMTIDASGNLGVGRTPNTDIRAVFQGADSTSSNYALGARDSAGNAMLLVRNDGYITTGIRTLSPYNNTTASAANMFVDPADGGLKRSTSALKYKHDVRDLELIDISVFRPVRYKSKCENDDQTKDHIGFIADEYVTTIPELVAFGADGQVENFNYERMTAVLCKKVQELEARLAALEAA